LSQWAEATIAKETKLSVREVAAMASVVHAGVIPARGNRTTGPAVSYLKLKKGGNAVVK
jgi:hypothetical protein